MVWVGLCPVVCFFFSLFPHCPYVAVTAHLTLTIPAGGGCAAEELQAVDEERSGRRTAGPAAAGGWSAPGQAEEGGILCHPHP